MRSGIVFNIQKYSIQDGPGIRTTVFLKGCPLRCRWCHNPEGVSAQPELIFFENRCCGCGACRAVCPTGAIGDGATAPARECSLCGACVAACPTGARQLAGVRMTSAAVVMEVLKDRLFYDDSSGGVTFSGGEPLAQPEFLKELLEAFRSRGIHTTVDTCGYAPREQLLSIMDLTDLFLYDLKLMDDARHRQFTSVSNGLILENLRLLGDRHRNIWIRVPVIPGVNDDDANAEAMAEFVASIPGVRQVNLLPYHNTAITKFKRLQQPYTLGDITGPTPEWLEHIRLKFQAHGLAAKTGG